MEKSFKDLQEIYARGLVPRGGDYLRQSFDELMHWIVHVQQQNEDVASSMSRVSAETGMLYQDAANTFEKLFAIGREINLDNPYNPDDLSRFRDLLRNAMDNDLPEIYARIQYKDGLTDNVKNNLMRLDDMCQNFYKLVEQEIQKNQEQIRDVNAVDEKGLDDLQLTQNNEREMHAQDIVQNPENDKRKLEEEQQQQDKEKDKNGLKKENPERRTGFSKSVKFTNQYTDKVDKKEKTPDEKIAELQRIDKMFDRAHSAESFKKMMFGIRDGVRAGLISRDQAKAYQAIFDEVKEHKNWENGIFLLSTELNVQQSEIRDAEKAKVGSYDKSSKFKDGIVNVLNMQREEKPKTNDNKKERDEFVKMLRRKKMKGLDE